MIFGSSLCGKSKRYTNICIAYSRWMSKKSSRFKGVAKSIPPVEVSQSNVDLSYDAKIVFIGSCFSEAMARRLKKLKFDCHVNPSHGILFNPVSIAECLSRISSRLHYEPHHIIQDSIHDDIFHSWHHHSSFSSTDPHKVLSSINSSLDDAHSNLTTCKAVFITLGSARIHSLVNNMNENESYVVANCHKRKNFIMPLFITVNFRFITIFRATSLF